MKIHPDKTEDFDKYIHKRWFSEYPYEELIEKSKEKAAKSFRVVHDKLRKLLHPYWKCLQTGEYEVKKNL